MRRSLSFSLAAAASLASVPAMAQGGTAAGAGVVPAPAAQPPAPTTTEVAALTPASTTPMPVPEDLLHAHPGGLTAVQVGKRSMDTSFAAKQSFETMRAAQGRVNAAWAAFLPRLSGTAKYTRLSTFTPPDLPLGGGVVISGTSLAPQFLDQALFQATLTVPISDYFLKIDQNYTAATHSVEAARFDVAAARATALANGKVAYYTWMNARGAVIVAVQALNDQRTHLNDARNQFQVGNASKADVLRAETSEASAELALVQAENAADLAEEQMRIALHIPAGPKLVPGEGLDEQPALFPGDLQALTREATTVRLELKSIRANALSARKTSEANKAGRYPVISAFGDALYANPNPRLFPARAEFFPTWDAGIQAVWAPNDILTANGNASDYEARANALDAQAQVTLEGIQVEVTQDFQTLKAAEFSLDSTKRQLASATEAYRVARELFNNGRGTSTTLTDAEGELTNARIAALNAQVNARIARVRLEHAVGRDLKEADSAH
ncbi:MAG TPA: TolC family protein [Polyangiaceae bacterium]